MEKVSKRGFVPEDEKQFSGKALEQLKQAATDVRFLLGRGYAAKPATVFVGNHFMFSERQRLALARSVSSCDSVKLRLSKQISGTGAQHVNIDGFNTIITLEVALSGSPVFICDDGTIRDLAELRGSYRLIDKTEPAVRMLLGKLDEYGVQSATFYLDAPVSNSGRLCSLINKCAEDYSLSVECMIIENVDSVLKESSDVITADAIILNCCASWINILPDIIGGIENVREIRLNG